MAKLKNPIHSTYARGTFAKSIIYQSSINLQRCYSKPFIKKKSRSAKQQANDVFFRDAVNKWKLLTTAERNQWQTVNVADNRDGFELQFFKRTKGYWQFIRQYITLSRAGLNPWKTPTVKW